MKGWTKRDPLNNNYVLVLANAVNFLGIAAWFFFFSTIVFAFYPSMLDTDVAEVLLVLVGSLAALAIFYLIVKPYVTLLAYNQPFDSREIYFHIEGTLPFFPKHSWYYRFIPYYRVNATKVNEIVNDLQVSRPFSNVDTDYGSSLIEAKPSWHSWAFTAVNLLFGLFSALLLLGILVSGERQLLAIIVFSVMLIFSSRAFYKQITGGKNLLIDNKGLRVNKVTITWEQVESIEFDWNEKFERKLIFKLKSGNQLSVSIGSLDISWQAVYNYVLFFHQQHKSSCQLN